MMSSAISSGLQALAQVTALLALWSLGKVLAAWWALPVPGGVIGLALLLLLFACRLVQPGWLRAGAGLLLAEMLLFFIPAVMSLLDYGPLLRAQGPRILLVIVSGTLLVMMSTALAVEWVCRRHGNALED